MFLAGFKPETTAIRSERKLRFFSTLDAAVGKAEDLILRDDAFETALSRRSIKSKSGFLRALEQIDEQVCESTLGLQNLFRISD